MDFTREPIVETVVTSRDGCKIVVRSSKNPGQEEFIVDALEVVSFGNASFFRSLERPRAFLLPTSDYEVLEIREPRLSLKAATLEGSMRKEVARPMPQPKEPPPARESAKEREEPLAEEAHQGEARSERRRDKRRSSRRRRGREEGRETRPETEENGSAETEEVSAKEVSPVVTAILPPPSTLIRDDLQRLRQSEQYKGAFYSRKEEGAKEEAEKEADDEAPVVPLSLEETQEDENAYKATPLPLEDDPQQPWLGKASTMKTPQE